jgi:hypothetical protein
MAAPAKVNLIIYQGSTFTEVLRWESSIKSYKSITNITNAAPAIISVTGHGVPDGWRVKIQNVLGMKEINSSDTYIKAKVLTSDTIELNDINAAGYSTYISGGILEYNTPISLVGITARMQIRDKLESTSVLLELTTENSGILVDDTNKTITINISAIITTELAWTTGVYSLEIINGTIVSTLITGNVTVKKEITR